MIVETENTHTRTYYSSDSVKESPELSRLFNGGSSDLLEYLSLLRDHQAPEAVLELKVGAVCSIMRNICPGKGLVKNARVVVTSLGRCYVEVAVLKDVNASIRRTPPTYCLPRITFEFKPNMAPWTVVRKQIPLRLAYASTFNSCQGLTLERSVYENG